MFDAAGTRSAAAADTAAAVVSGTVMAVGRAGVLHFLWPLRHCMEDEKPTRMHLKLFFKTAQEPQSVPLNRAPLPQYESVCENIGLIGFLLQSESVSPEARCDLRGQGQRQQQPQQEQQQDEQEEQQRYQEHHHQQSVAAI